MSYVIRTDEPFRGVVQTVVKPDGTLAYTEGLTVEQYAAKRGFPVRVIDDAELEKLVEEYEDSLVEEPVEETEAEWWYALEVLPPCRYGTVGGVELFHISERLSGSIVAWHAVFGGRYWRFNDRAGRPGLELAEKVRKAAGA